VKQERHLFHDREQITIFLNYHEEVTPNRRDKEIEKEASVKETPIRKLDNEKYSN
jgi:hypothetical protein